MSIASKGTFVIYISRDIQQIAVTNRGITGKKDRGGGSPPPRFGDRYGNGIRRYSAARSTELSQRPWMLQ